MEPASRWMFGLAVCICLFIPARAVAQEPTAQTPAQNIATEQPKSGPLFHVDQFSFESNIEYYAPQPGFDRQNRDIDIQVARAAVGAHLRSGWEFLASGFLFRADGTRTEASLAPNPPQVASNAVGVGVGPMVRWNFLEMSRFRVFLDAEGSLLIADRPFPQNGSVYDFFLRAGGGVSVRVSNSYSIESAFHFAHISNGKGIDSANPTWQGNGVSLGIRRVFGHKASSAEGHSKPLFRFFRKTNENAWVTGFEYYAPLPAFTPRGANFQGDIRAVRVSRAWHFPSRLELQLGGMVQKTDSAMGLGGLLRWNFLEQTHLRLFADAGADFIQAGSPVYIIPWPGDGYTGFLRVGGGASWRIHPSYWLEAGFRWAHIPSGFGSGANGFPEWSGQGGSFSLRHTF
jgi:hypothetical protein